MSAPQHVFPGFEIALFDVVPSTNDTILEAGGAGAPEGTTHIARSQTRGRGRAGRSWWSPPGAGLWMSTLLRPTCPRDRWSGLALIAGVGVKVALRRLEVRGVELEWPNDLKVSGRKLGGILCEVRGDKSGAWLAVGLGLNVDLTAEATRRSIPQSLRSQVTCMTAEGPPSTRDPVEISQTILGDFAHLYDRFLRGETAADLAGPHLSHAGRPVRVERPDGTLLRGTIVGLSDVGELLVRRGDDTIEEIVAGDVHYEYE